MKINMKNFAIKYLIAKELSASLEADKAVLKGGNYTTTYNNDCNVTVTSAIRYDYTAEDKMKLDAYASKVGICKVPTEIRSVRIMNISDNTKAVAKTICDSINNVLAAKKVASKTKDKK